MQTNVTHQKPLSREGDKFLPSSADIRPYQRLIKMLAFDLFMRQLDKKKQNAHNQKIAGVSVASYLDQPDSSPSIPTDYSGEN